MRYPALETQSRRERAVRLALAGRSYDEIATELGYASRSGAWKAVNRALRARTDAAVDEYRALEISRLERLLTGYYPRAMQGDRTAAEMCLKIIDTEVKLLGLDSPGALERKVTSVLVDGNETEPSR